MRGAALQIGVVISVIGAGVGPVVTPASEVLASPPKPGQPEGGTAKVGQLVLDQLAEGGTTDFWVYLDDTADLAAASAVTDRAAQGEWVYERLLKAAEESQRELREILDDERAEYETFWIADTVRVTGGEDLLTRISALPDVEQITADRIYGLPEPVLAAEDVPGGDSVDWNIAGIRAPRVWDEFGATGEGIVVGSIDSGVQFDHPALVSQYRGNQGDGEFDHNYSWYDPSEFCDTPSREPCDNNGHGTHTTGTMAGADGGVNQIGVAPGAQWIAAKGCERESCSQSALLLSAQFMLAPTNLAGDDPKPALRPHVVNNSWGGAATNDPWYQQVVQAWVAAGIFPVFAAGNTGPDCGTAGNPGNMPDAYAVGAFDEHNAIAPFSSRGPSAFDAQIVKPDIAAPGVNIRSALPDDAYGLASGTSMAAPHVAGTIALMWSAAPAIGRDVEATRELLDLTAVDVDDTSCGGDPHINNVWGEGKLDAFAAVTESPRGPAGELTGIVADATTDEPIAGATVTITGAVDRVQRTLPDGTYLTSLPIGEYTMTASAFGYDEQPATVTITTDQTTTRDFSLSAVERVKIHGHLTDGSGHGWPLYARVDAVGTSVETYSDPVTGAYTLSLPANAEYTIVAKPRYPGYADARVTVEVGNADETLDLAVEVDPHACHRAPGHEFDGEVAVLGDFEIPPFRELAIGEFLDRNGIPSSRVDWDDDLSGYDAIVVNAPGDRGKDAFKQFLADTDASGTGVVFLDTGENFGGNGIWQLWQHIGNPRERDQAYLFPGLSPHVYYEVIDQHPILGGFEVGEQIVLNEPGTMSFKPFASFGGYAGDSRAVIADASAANTGTLGSGIGVQERDNNRHVLLSLHGAAQSATPDRRGFNPEHWTDDGARVFLNALRWASTGASLECVQVDGGLVVGQVEDLNTGLGVADASVTSVGKPDEFGMSASVSDDPSLGDGFYWLFSSRTGQQEFRASGYGYVDRTRNVEVAPGAVTRAEFTLAAGKLTVTPAQVIATGRPGLSLQRSFTITNTGTAPAELELDELTESVEGVSGNGNTEDRAQVRRVKGHVSPAARGRGETPGDAPPSSATAESRSDNSTSPGQDVPTGSSAGLDAAPWTDLPEYPLRIMDNAAAAADGRLYSFGGYAEFPGSTWEDRAYTFDPQVRQWRQISDMPAGRQKPEAVEINGLIYVVGGWQQDAASRNTAATTFIYDPARDTWSRGTDMPEGRAAPGVAVLDDQLYVVGGCLDVTCIANTNLWRYDPKTDKWEELAEYPEPTAWLACAGLAGEVYCTGGTSGLARDTSASTYAYHPGKDRWIRQADLPYDNWGMAYAGANGQLVVSGGTTDGFSATTNRGAAYHPDYDRWEEIEPSKHATTRVAGACGFYRVGGELGGLIPTPTTVAEVHPGLDGCADDVDVPWLDLNVATMTVAPGERVSVTVSLQTDVDEPGSHQSGVRIRHDTPYQTGPVGVTMIVREAVNCDETITGTHTGPLRVTAGVTCVADGARIVGPTTVDEGASLLAGDASFTGQITAVNSDIVEMVGSRLTGPLRIRGATGSVLLSGTRIVGPARLIGNVTEDNPIIVSDNQILGVLACSKNEPRPINEGASNTVTGPQSGQCSDL